MTPDISINIETTDAHNAVQATVAELGARTHVMVDPENLNKDPDPIVTTDF